MFRMFNSILAGVFFVCTIFGTSVSAMAETVTVGTMPESVTVGTEYDMIDIHVSYSPSKNTFRINITSEYRTPGFADKVHKNHAPVYHVSFFNYDDGTKLELVPSNFLVHGLVDMAINFSTKSTGIEMLPSMTFISCTDSSASYPKEGIFVRNIILKDKDNGGETRLIFNFEEAINDSAIPIGF